jgi:hypothetical protein
LLTACKDNTKTWKTINPAIKPVVNPTAGLAIHEIKCTFATSLTEFLPEIEQITQ